MLMLLATTSINVISTPAVTFNSKYIFMRATKNIRILLIRGCEDALIQNINILNKKWIHKLYQILFLCLYFFVTTKKSDISIECKIVNTKQTGIYFYEPQMFFNNKK